MAEKDIAPEMWERIRRLYQSGKLADAELQNLLKKTVKTYEQAHRYAIRLGENTSRALLSVLTEDALPNGRMYFNIAERTVRPALSLAYEDVVSYCEEAQADLNAAAEIGIKPIKPKMNDDRIVGIINRLTGDVDFESIKWILGAPVVNFTQSIVDDSVITNADFHKKAGLSPKIVRTSDGKCCEWCDKLVGTYDYPVDNKAVYQRHDNCNCITDYYDSEGNKNGVWGNRVGQLTAKTEKKRQQQQRQGG